MHRAACVCLLDTKPFFDSSTSSIPICRADSSPYRDTSSVVTKYGTEEMHRDALDNVIGSHPGYDKDNIRTPATEIHSKREYKTKTKQTNKIN